MLKNNRDRLLTAILLLALCMALFATTVSAFGEDGSFLSVSARAAALYEPETDSFLLRKNADLRLPMASTTKIMTALVAIREGDPDRVVTVDPRAVGVEGSSLYLEAGERLTMRELLYGLLLRSANDAAEAIAYELCGGIEQFAERMNDLAAGIGAADTHFENPHGLDAEEHFTTAGDLARIAACALEEPLFREIVSTKQIRIENGDHLVRLLKNHNKMLSLYDGCIGVKTGYTKRSGRCLVSAAEKEGLRMIAVTLDAPDDWSDHAALLDLGYSKLHKYALADAGDFRYEIPVTGGDAEKVILENREPFSVIADKSDHLFTNDVHLSRYFSAPIAEGERLGEVVFYQDGREIGRIPLYAQNAVNEPKKKGFFSFFRK